MLCGGLVAPEVVDVGEDVPGEVVIGIPPTVEVDGVVGGRPGLCRFKPGVGVIVVPADRPGAGCCVCVSDDGVDCAVCAGSGEPGIDELVPAAAGVVVVSDVLGVPLGLDDGAALTDEGGVVVAGSPALDGGVAVVVDDVDVVGDGAALVPPVVGESCANVGGRSVGTSGRGLGVDGAVRTRSPSGIPPLAARGSASPDSAAAASAIS